MEHKEYNPQISKAHTTNFMFNNLKMTVAMGLLY
jgi:hypothetical protein